MGPPYHSRAQNRTAITRVSKYFHGDTKEALKKYGVYRLHIEHEHDGELYISRPSFPSDNFFVNIQNLSIDVELAKPHPSRHPIEGPKIFSIIQDLVEAMRKHGHCYIEVVRPRFGTFVLSELAGFEDSGSSNMLQWN